MICQADVQIDENHHHSSSKQFCCNIDIEMQYVLIKKNDYPQFHDYALVEIEHSVDSSAGN